MRFAVPVAALFAALLTVPAVAAATQGCRMMGTTAAMMTSPAALLRQAPPASRFPNADTYWLRWEQTTTVQKDGASAQTFHATGRILTTRGMDNADVTVPFQAASQTVTNLQARTIRPDGSVLRVRPADIHVTSPNSDFTLYDDARNVAFSLPGVEPGAIVDYQYTVRTRQPLQKGQFSDAWWLAGSDPVRLTRYTLIFPTTLPLRFAAHHAAGVRFTPSRSADGTRRILTWETRNTPGQADEPDGPPDESVLPWVEVSTWPGWPSVAQWYGKLAGPQMTPSPEITTLVRRLTLGQRTEQEKARALFYWVETHTRYVALEQGLSAYRPHAAAAVCRNRYGDCKDMATLLITMLRAADIAAAWPALLDTESHEALHAHLAVPDTFDHVIVRADLDGEPFWFDATAQFCTFGDIPGDDRGQEAFVVRGGAGRFETIPDGGPEVNRTVTQKVVTLHADGSAECRVSVRGEGDAALEGRAQMEDLPPDQWPDHVQRLVDSGPDVTLQRYALSACANPAVPLTYTVQYSSPAWATRTAGLLIVTDGFVFHDLALPRSRRTPLCVRGGQQSVSDTRIVLPPGCVPEALPEPVQVQTPLGTASAVWTMAAGVLHIHRVLTRGAATVSVPDYPRVHAQWEQAIGLLRQPVVLRREPSVLTAVLPQK